MINSNFCVLETTGCTKYDYIPLEYKGKETLDGTELWERLGKPTDPDKLSVLFHTALLDCGLYGHENQVNIAIAKIPAILHDKDQKYAITVNDQDNKGIRFKNGYIITDENEKAVLVTTDTDREVLSIISSIYENNIIQSNLTAHKVRLIANSDDVAFTTTYIKPPDNIPGQYIILTIQ